MALMPRRDPALVKSRRDAATARTLAAFQAAFRNDPVLFTAYGQRGLQVPDTALQDFAGAMSDLNKTTVAAWAAGATANPNGGVEANAAGWADATAQAKFNALLAKLRTAAVIS